MPVSSVRPKRESLGRLSIGLAASLLAWICSTSVAQAQSATYVYDNLGRLIQVTYDDGSVQAYGYDPAGNRSSSLSGPAAGLLQFAADAYTINEAAGSVVVEVKRLGGTTGSVAVQYATSNGTASAGSDYTASSGTLSFAAGQASRTISIPIASVAGSEAAETFSVALSSPTGGAAIGTPTVTITIVDSEPLASFSIANASANENAASLSLTVTKTGTTTGTHDVSYATVSDTASSNIDFTTTSGVLSFAASETSKTITVPLLDDAAYEGAETFKVVLRNPTAGASIAQATAVATIVDNEAPPAAGLVRFSASSYSTSEATPFVSVTVSRANGTLGAISVVCSTTSGGTALAGTDYTAVSTTLTWADADAGDKSCDVPLVNDSVYESTETINVALTNVTGGASLGSPSTATINVSSDDAGQVGSLSLSANAATVAENGGSVTFTVYRINGADGPAAATCATNNGSALAGTDYQPLTQALGWAAGDASSRTCTVQLIDDNTYGGNKSLFLSLTNVSGAALGTPDSATITVADNEPQPTFTISDATAPDVNGAVMNFTVTKSGATELSHSVLYQTVSNTARDVASGTTYSGGADFNRISGTLTFAPGETSKTLSVGILDGVAPHYEPNETFFMDLSSPSNGAVITRARATGTIVEDDPAPAYNIVFLNTDTVAEGGVLQFTVNSQYYASELTHSVDYTVVSGTATAGADFQQVSGTLTFAPGESTYKTVSVQTYDDAAVEAATETVYMQLSNPTNGATLAETSDVAYISDNDNTFPSKPLNMRTDPDGYATGVYRALWDASSGQVAYYQLERDTDTGFTAPNYNLYTINAPTTSQSFTQPTAEKDFFFRVRACNSSNQCSGWSNIAQITAAGSGGGGGGGGGKAAAVAETGEQQ